jgi:hypothetical protein
MHDDAIGPNVEATQAVEGCLPLVAGACSSLVLCVETDGRVDSTPPRDSRPRAPVQTNAPALPQSIEVPTARPASRTRPRRRTRPLTRPRRSVHLSFASRPPSGRAVAFCARADGGSTGGDVRRDPKRRAARGSDPQRRRCAHGGSARCGVRASIRESRGIRGSGRRASDLHQRVRGGVGGRRSAHRPRGARLSLRPRACRWRRLRRKPDRRVHPDAGGSAPRKRGARRGRKPRARGCVREPRRCLKRDRSRGRVRRRRPTDCARYHGRHPPHHLAVVADDPPRPKPPLSARSSRR